MSARFLAQVAHRAIAGSEVKPRITARFETLAPLEPSVVSEAPTATPERAVAPARPAESIEPAPPRAQPQDAPAPATRTVTHTEIVEHVKHREVPVFPEPASPPAPRLERAQRDEAHTEPPRVPAAPLRETPFKLPPLPAREDSAPVPSRGLATASDTTSPAAASAVARAAPTPAALLVPAAPVAPLAVSTAVSPRLEPAAAPALAPIEIVIGRIEIRSDTAASAPRVSVPAPRRAAVSLDAYLRGREEPKR